MKFFLPVAVAVVLTVVAAFYVMRSAEVAPGEIAVTQAWARATPPGASVGAVYLTIANSGGAEDRLIGVTSPAAQSAMLHQTMEENGVSTMRASEGGIAPGAKFEMKPGGSHIMLMGLKAPLEEGGTVEVILDFAKAGKVSAIAKVAPIGAAGPMD